MSQPDSGEYSVRSLAEILREHGLETELGTRPGRRRRTSDDPEVTGRSPRVEAAPRGQRPQGPAAPKPSAAPARSSAPVRSPGQAAPAARTPAAAPAAARVPVTTWPDPSANASRPAAGLAGPLAPSRAPTAAAEPAVREARVPAEDRTKTTGPVAGRSDATRADAARSDAARADAASPAVRTGRRKSDGAATDGADRAPGLFGTGPTTSAIPALDAAATTSRRAEAHPVTGPIPVQRAEAAPAADDEPLTGKESVLAWVRFAGELVLALAVGIGLYFAFTVLWELMPYVALVAAPAAVTALVAGVAAYRQRRGQGTLGVRLLAVLLLAGTVLVIAPAAGLLAG